LAAEADSYLWNPGGEITQSIEVSESGMFNVTVTYDTLGCVSTSQNIQIVKNESPSASFETDKFEIDRNEDVEIYLTDQSVQAAGWFWKLSDGQTSTEQNPVFTVNTIEPIEVILTATSNNGCQDQDIQTIDVITSLDDENELSESLKFYPNPTTGQIKVELVNEYTGIYEIMIFNTMGKMVKHYNFSKDGEFAQSTIDLNGLAKGMYLLQIDQNPIGRTTSKILLK
jgi:PKD repeat protein